MLSARETQRIFRVETFERRCLVSLRYGARRLRWAYQGFQIDRAVLFSRISQLLLRKLLCHFLVHLKDLFKFRSILLIEQLIRSELVTLPPLR